MTPTRRSPILIYLVMLMGFVFGFLYNNQLDASLAAPVVPVTFQLATLKGLDTLKIDYSVLSSPQFQELRVFGQLPVLPGSGGSGDLFQ